MQTDHHLARMDADAHPVPRFEVFHKPRRLITGAGGVVLEDAPNPQPWHTRAIAANGEPLDSTETFVHLEGAFGNLIARARMLGVDGYVHQDGETYTFVTAEVAIPIVITEVDDQAEADELEARS